MDTDEAKVKRYLEERGFSAERFSKAEKRAGKTPDFRVFRNGEFLFYCEVKSSPADRWLDEQLDEQLNCALPCKEAGGVRNDPIFNRLAKDIHEAVKQFDAVNQDQRYPNVLALVNHDDMCEFNDLLGVLTGNFYSDDGTAHSIYRQYSHGRNNDQRGKAHLYIWMDDHKEAHLLFSQIEEDHHVVLCTAFGIEQNEIKRVSS